MHPKTLYRNDASTPNRARKPCRPVRSISPLRDLSLSLTSLPFSPPLLRQPNAAMLTTLAPADLKIALGPHRGTSISAPQRYRLTLCISISPAIDDACSSQALPLKPDHCPRPQVLALYSYGPLLPGPLISQRSAFNHYSFRVWTLQPIIHTPHQPSPKAYLSAAHSNSLLSCTSSCRHSKSSLRITLLPDRPAHYTSLSPIVLRVALSTHFCSVTSAFRPSVCLQTAK